LASNSVDFATADSANTLADSIATPDMISIPLAAQALVVVYNLPGITDGSISLSMDLITRIFLGNITKWNDPSIMASNPGISLPNSDIILVTRGDISTLTTVLHTALSTHSTKWSTSVSADSNGILTWPYTTNMLVRTNFFGHGTALATIPYTLSYMWLDEANALGIPYANFQNKLGAIIKPTSNSVLFAVMEKGATPLESANSGLLDLTIPSGNYPIPHSLTISRVDVPLNMME
jgi:phosphate transport system substrate-binding protein